MRRTLLPVAVVVVALLATSACGVRLETPEPAAPSPGPVEQVRARTVDDALALSDAATAIAGEGTSLPTELAAVLSDVISFGQVHAAALGGVYDSGLPTATPTLSPASSPSAAVTPSMLLDQLAAAAVTASVDTDTLTDPDLARLVGSVAVARGELTQRLAQVLDVVDPAIAPPPAESPRAPDLPVSTVQALALAHDQAGYGLEVIAAQARADLLTPALASAESHRARATAWARVGGFDGTEGDPRRVHYLLPDGLSDPDAARESAALLELAVAEACSAALAAAAPGTRASLLADLRAATAAADGWGAAPKALPGLLR
ncbi:MAG: ferritin-like domain-containing protein [Micrococcales bacterium]|nr:ferritin-like domain-containing protein [Micrococcales bacterium]